MSSKKGVEEGVHGEGQTEDTRDDGIRCPWEWEEDMSVRSEGKGSSKERDTSELWQKKTDG